LGQLLGVLEGQGITVGNGQHQEQALPFADLLPVELEILVSHAHYRFARSVVAHELFQRELLLPAFVSGSRACRWTIAAPAFAASMADAALSFGVTGAFGLRPVAGALPVTAQEMMRLAIGLSDQTSAGGSNGFPRIRSEAFSAIM
jgi:hypothetical protein